MAIGYWLFPRRRAPENMRHLNAIEKEFGSSPLPEGILVPETRDVTCPHCAHKLSWVEAMERRGVGFFCATECPKCGKTFKQH